MQQDILNFGQNKNTFFSFLFFKGTVMLKGIKFCSRWLIAVHSNEDDDEKNDAAHGSTNGNTDQFLWQTDKKQQRKIHYVWNELLNVILPFCV